MTVLSTRELLAVLMPGLSPARLPVAAFDINCSYRRKVAAAHLRWSSHRISHSAPAPSEVVCGDHCSAMIVRPLNPFSTKASAEESPITPPPMTAIPTGVHAEERSTSMSRAR